MSAGMRAPAPTRLVFTGQSMLFYPPLPEPTGLSIPELVAAALGGLAFENIGHEGMGWADLQALADDELVPQARNHPGRTDILVMFGGQGDILNTYPAAPPTAATCYGRAVTYATTARAAGFDRIVCCTMPAIGPILGRPTVAEAAVWAATNTLLVDDADEAFDAVARTDLAPLDDATNLEYFLFDRTHLTPAGGRAATAIIAPVVLP